MSAKVWVFPFSLDTVLREAYPGPLEREREIGTIIKTALASQRSAWSPHSVTLSQTLSFALGWQSQTLHLLALGASFVIQIRQPLAVLLLISSPANTQI